MSRGPSARSDHRSHAAAVLPPRARRAFTLVEVMVVIGLLLALVGGFGMALAGRGGEGAALSNAQSLVSGLVSTARAQAVLHQTNARLIVHAQMPPGSNLESEKYLRMLQIVRQDTLANGNQVWVAIGPPVSLPAPICIVPTSPVPTTHLRLPTGQNWNNNVATGPVSTFSTATGFNYRGHSTATANQFFGANGSSGRIFFLQFGPDGTVNAPPTTPTKIALATAILGVNALPLFNSATTVRGLLIRRTGAVSLVDQATGF